MKNATQERPNIKVKIWMIRNNLNMSKVAKEYGIGQRFVSQFLKGIKTSKGLAQFMIDMGCPKECFDSGKLAKNTNVRNSE
jgi:predicted transcriptional regulator